MNIADFWRKTPDVNRNQGVFHVIYIFLDLLKARYNCAKCHHCGICVADFKEGSLFLPICEQLQKGPS